jgi:hypothetical protein
MDSQLQWFSMQMSRPI